MFAIRMHFMGEYWIIENMCLKIWYMPLKPAIRWFPLGRLLLTLMKGNNLQTKKTSAKHTRKCQGNKRNMTRTETFLTPTFSFMDFCGFRAVSEWFHTPLGGLADLDGRNNWQTEKTWTQHTRKCQTARCIFNSMSSGVILRHLPRTSASRMAHRLRQTSIIFRDVEFLLAHRRSKWTNSEAGNSNTSIYYAFYVQIVSQKLTTVCLFEQSELLSSAWHTEFHGISNIQTWRWSTLYSYGFY